MIQKHCGKSSVRFENRPRVLSSAAVGGKKEAEGPLSEAFDHLNVDTKFGKDSWEQAEREMQRLALETAEQKGAVGHGDLDALFAGDLLNQCISSSFTVRDTGIPFLGLYGACSTMAEALLLAACAVDGGYAAYAAAMTSSHFATAERQYRFPLNYGGQRTPTSQWTVTGAGCMILQSGGDAPFIRSATVGAVCDYGITDANNMGAAMAPAAYHTLRQHFDDLGLAPSDYDLIVTGDLGTLGRQIVLDFFERDGVKLGSRYNDCGCMIFDAKKQDVHAGGSGCGCSATVLCGHLMREMKRGKLKNLLFCATGALLSPTSTQQGESIPGICHAVSFGTERR
ncbi:MAG: stage V sporulation protein AD [Oscillospiraceae bacterium]|nr:stage V sporulation protein AD [Oscillospiraceae bacterium]